MIGRADRVEEELARAHRPPAAASDTAIETPTMKRKNGKIVSV